MPVEITAGEFEDIDRALIALARLETPFTTGWLNATTGIFGTAIIRLDHAVARKAICDVGSATW